WDCVARPLHETVVATFHSRGTCRLRVRTPDTPCRSRSLPAAEVLMHILELSDFYRPIIGGLERHVETFSRELVRLGHTVTVVTLQTGDRPAEEILDGV